MVGSRQTFVFTDIEDSTGRAGRLGDAAWSELLRQHNDLLAEVVVGHRGREVKKTGDGAMLVFEETAAAVHCVRQIQQTLAEIGLPVRAGVHCGEAIGDGDDYIGIQVHIAARVGALASGGELLVSAAARHQIGDNPDIRFGPPRTVELRGVSGLHRVYPVVPESSGPAASTRPLVGRDRELADLTEAVEAARHGARAAILVVGEPGAGKSRLVEELIGQTEGMAVHWGRCLDSERSPAYLPWMEIIRSLVAEVDPRPEFTPLVHILPELSSSLDAPPRLPADAEGARATLFNAVAALLHAASERRPQLVVLEDIHSADATSTDLLRHVISATAGQPLLLLATSRLTDDEGIRALHDAIEPGNVIKLGQIGAEDIARYLTSELGRRPSTETVLAVTELTEGNPFNLTQIAPLLVADGQGALPGSVQSSVRRRLEALSSDASWLLEVAAVLGKSFELTTLFAAAGVSESEAITSLDEAATATIVHWESPSPSAEFVHQLLQQAVYERVPAGRRAVLHGQVARALETTLDDDGRTKLSQTAYHYVRAARAGYTRQAFERSLQAATGASLVHAHEEAARHLREALLMWDDLVEKEDLWRLTILADLGREEMMLGHRLSGWESLHSMMEPALELGEVELAARALASWPVDWTPGGEFEPSLVSRVLQLLPEGNSLRPTVLAMQAAMEGFLDQEEVELTGATAWADAQDSGDDSVMAEVLSRLLNSAEELDIGPRLVELGQRLADDSYVAQGWRFIGGRRLDEGDTVGAEAAYLEQARCADAVGSPIPRADARWRLAGLAVNRGDATAAQNLMAQAAAFEQQTRNQASRLVGIGLQLLICRNEGRLQDLEVLTAMARAQSSLGPIILTVRPVLALIGLAAGTAETAELALRDVPRRPFLGGSGYWRIAACSLADVALSMADVDVMTELAGSLSGHRRPLAIVPGSCGIYAHVDEIVGKLELALGHDEHARRRLATALDYYRTVGARPLEEKAEALVALAAEGGLPADPVARARVIAATGGLPADPRP